MWYSVSSTKMAVIQVVQVTGTLLEDPDISNENLDLVLAVANGVFVNKRKATMKIKVKS